MKNLRDFQKAFDLVGGGMKKLDSSHWKGEAADTFRKKFPTLPTDWLHAADAFEDAAEGPGDVLQRGHQRAEQGQGGDRPLQGGQRGFQDGGRRVQQEGRRLQRRPQQRQPAASARPLLRPRHGQARSGRRRSSRKPAGTATRRRDGEDGASPQALAHAPKEPTGREKLKLELTGLRPAPRASRRPISAGGVIKGTAGLLNFVRSINPIDPLQPDPPRRVLQGPQHDPGRPRLHRREPGPRPEERVGGAQERPERVLGPALPGGGRHEGRSVSSGAGSGPA